MTPLSHTQLHQDWWITPLPTCGNAETDGWPLLATSGNAETNTEEPYPYFSSKSGYQLWLICYQLWLISKYNRRYHFEFNQNRKCLIYLRPSFIYSITVAIVDRCAWPDKTTPLPSVWSMALSTMAVEYQQLIYLSQLPRYNSSRHHTSMYFLALWSRAKVVSLSGKGTCCLRTSRQSLSCALLNKRRRNT